MLNTHLKEGRNELSVFWMHGAGAEGSRRNLDRLGQNLPRRLLGSGVSHGLGQPVGAWREISI